MKNATCNNQELFFKRFINGLTFLEEVENWLAKARATKVFPVPGGP
jgi:hypothetical protein